MAQLTTLQLIEAFKSFVAACQETMEMPPLFQRKWQVFSHYLNIYPLQSSKLVEFSTKCGDPVLEERFIDENKLRFTLQDTHVPDLTRSLNVTTTHTPLPTPVGKASMVTFTKPEEYKTDQFVPKLLEQLRGAEQKMRNNTRFYKERLKKPTPLAPNVQESCISVMNGDTIKKIDAKELRRRIIILKDKDRQMSAVKGPGKTVIGIKSSNNSNGK